uniref:Chromosome 8 open reading frame 34 n=1 Tax=Oncorhynchus kisutch TaxID=8019 RepID=A0A8C7I4P4_ONCKI
MASQQQSRIQSYLEKNKIGPLFEEMMASLISQTPDHPVPFLISHLQTKPGSPGKLHRTLPGSAALWAQSDAESKGGPDFRSYQKPWQIHPNKPKKSKSDLAVSNISLPSAESKSLPRSIEQPWWEWRESGDFNLILQESKTLGKALENLSRSIAVSDELDQNLGGYNSVLQPRVVGEWVGREEEDPDPLAAEMLQPPVPRTKTEAWGSADSSPAGSGKSKGLKQQQQHHKRLLAAMLSQESFDSAHSSAPSLTEEEMEDEDDVMELLEDLDDLRMEGVTGMAPSGSKFSQGRSSYCPEPQAKVTLNICSRCARLQGDSLSDASRPAEEHHGSPQHVPTQGPPYPLRLFPEHTAVNMPDGHGLPHRLQAVPTGGLLLSDSLFSKELEDMGKHLAEVEKDLAKLAEQGKLAQRSPNSPHSSLLTPLFHTSLPASLPSTLPLPGQTSRPQSPILIRSAKPSSIGYPLVSPKLSPLLTRKPTSLTMTGSHRTHSPSNSGGRMTTPRTPSSRPMTPNSLLTSKSAMTAVTPGVSVHRGHRGHKEVTFRKSRSRPVTPTSQPTRPRPLLTPPGLSTTDSLGKASSLKGEFYKQLQAIRQPWHIPIDTESDILEPLEQDKSEEVTKNPTVTLSTKT